MRRFFLKLLRRRRLERDLEAELAFHREMAAAQGNPIRLGNATTIKEQAFDLWRFNHLENLWRDLVYAARGLRHSPGFVLSALLSLGLGIGANTAIFSIAVEFLFSRPSVRDAGSLAYVRLAGNSHAEPKVLEFVRASHVFKDVTGENEETYINWNDGQQTHPIFAERAARNYFTALGIPVAYGRGWTESDPKEVVVLSYQFWRRHYNRDPSILGRVIELDGRAYTVTGILPESHRSLIGYGYSPDLYVPSYLDNTVLAMYVRLNDGMIFSQARAALRTIAIRLDAVYPKPWKYENGMSATPVAGFARLRQDPDAMTVGLFFAFLLVVVGLVLLIACINVAGLLLARSAARGQEIAIRLSLGASRGRLFQQLLTESFLLSVLGTSLGFAIALVAARFLAAIPLPIPFPIRLHVEPDWRLVAYATALAVFTTIACGLTPAWQSVKISLRARLHRERRLRLRRTLVVAQICVSFVVLTTGALFLHNLLRSSAISVGFDLHNTLRADVHLPPALYSDGARIEPYVDQALRRLRAIPGIEGAAAARIVPFTDATRFGSDLTFTDTGEKRHAMFNWNAVTADFFRVMDVPVLAGRAFNAQDSPGARSASAARERQKVVIVNSAFARLYLGKRNPIGCTFQWGDNKTLYQIVGIVRGTKNITIGEEDRAQLYQPLAQIEDDRSRIQFVLRSVTPPSTQLAAVREVLRQVEPAAGLDVSTLYASVGFAFLPSQIGAALMGSMGGLGLLLAAIGLYGVLAYAVTSRTREIGVRMALGATGGEICRLIVREAAALIAIGSVAGLAIGFLITKPLARFLVPGLSPSDPASFVAVIVVLAVTGFLAALGPVRRAVAVDAGRCLRYE